MKNKKKKGPGLFAGISKAILGVYLGGMFFSCLPVSGIDRPAFVMAASASEEYQRINAVNGVKDVSSLRSEIYSIYEDSKSQSPDKSETNIGPGGMQEVVDETEQSGPKIEDASMSETYHEDFDIYEENLKGSYFIYATVANGGITDQSVIIDIPSGLDYTMEKDGAAISYTSGQPVSERGTYVLRLNGVDDVNLPFSEQTIYKAVFRFRIQDRPVKETEEETEVGGYGLPQEDEAIDLAALIRERESLEAEESGSVWEEGMEGVRELTDTPMESEEGQDTEEEQEEQSPESFILDNGSYNQEAIDAYIDQVIGTDATDPENLEGYNPGNGLAQTYDSLSGYYVQTLLTGSAFYTNVPNGMLTTESVIVRNGENDVAFTVYKDDEPVEYAAGKEITEPGSYMVLAAESTTLFISGYSGRTAPVFRFRILPSAVNDLGTVAAPEGTTIEEVLLDGETLSDAVTEDGRYARLTRDGQYVVWFSDERGRTPVEFVLDRSSPRFVVQVEKNRALIGWNSDDVVRCELAKDSEVQEVSGAVFEVTGSGTYTLTAYDAAGNTGVSQFKVPFALNMAAIICVLLVILLIVAAVVFARNVNARMKVR